MSADKYHSIVFIGPANEADASPLREALTENALVVGDGKIDLSIPLITGVLAQASSDTHIHFIMHGGVVDGRHMVQLSNDGATFTSDLLGLLETKATLHFWNCEVGEASKEKAPKENLTVIYHGGKYSIQGNTLIEGITSLHEFSQKAWHEHGRLPDAFDAFEFSLLTSPETVSIRHGNAVLPFKASTPHVYTEEELGQKLQDKLDEFRDFRKKEWGHEKPVPDISPRPASEQLTYYLQRALVNEAGRGKTNHIHHYLDHGVDINYQLIHGHGVSSLYAACDNGHLNTAEALLDRGADINLGSRDGTSPLFIASQSRHKEVVKMLLERGADINLADNTGRTPLFIACVQGDKEVVEILLEREADINLATNNGYTPLFIASMDGRNEIVEILLNRGADINLANNRGATPLWIACDKGKVAVVETLLAHGADPTKGEYGILTPLMIAAENGKDAVVDVLLQHPGTTKEWLQQRTDQEKLKQFALSHPTVDIPEFYKNLHNRSAIDLARDYGKGHIAEKIKKRIKEIEKIEKQALVDKYSGKHSSGRGCTIS